MDKEIFKIFLESYFWAYNFYAFLCFVTVLSSDYEKYKKVKIDNGTYFDDFGKLTSIIGLALYIISIKLT